MADLLQSWYQNNAVGSDYLPRLLVQGRALQDNVQKIEMQKQQVQNQYAQFQAETARANQQAEFQDRKFLYAMNQDKMDRTRQSMLDQAQINNWKADNTRQDAAAAGTKAYQDAQIENWKSRNKEDAPMNFDWIESGEDPAQTTTANETPLPQTSGGSDSELPSGEGQVSSELLPETGALGPVGPTGTAYASPPSDSLANHPGKAKWEMVQRGSVLSPGMIAGMKSSDRAAALAALGKVNVMKSDPQVLDYQRRLAASENASMNSFKQDEMDKGQSLEFANDAREAKRQDVAIDHYAGADLPFGLNQPQSDAMKNIRKGIPANDWKSALAEERKIQENPPWQQQDTAQAEIADWKKRNDTSIDGRANKAIEKANVNQINESKQWTSLKEAWAKENPLVMKVITDSVIAGKAGGQALTKDALLEQIDKLADENDLNNPWGGESSWNKMDSKMFHPDPSNRKSRGANGAPLSNGEMASMIYEQMLSSSKDAGKDAGIPKPSTPEEALKLPKGTRYIGPDGVIRARQ